MSAFNPLPRMLRNALTGIVPPWLANRVGLNTGFRILYATALLGDTLIEQVWEGLFAAFPGVGTDTALPLIAASRGMLQGPGEANAAFAVRLRSWLLYWLQAGSAEILAQQIQSYCVNQGILGGGGVPVVRIVDRNGNWVVANSDGTTTFTSAPFDWDEVLGWDDGTRPVPGSITATYWSDMWIVIAPPTGISAPIWPVYPNFADATWISNWGAGATKTLGSTADLAVAQGVMQLVAAWKGAHTWFQYVIVAGDSTSFSPSTPTADGTYGNVGKLVNGVEVPARAAAARYWAPLAGG